MPPTDISRFLHAIADPARRRILQELKSCTSEKTGLCAGDVEDRVKLSQPTVSHHMKVLEKAGLVEVKKEGTWRRYHRKEKLIRSMIQALKGQL